MNISHRGDHHANGVDLRRTRRQFLLAREQASQASAEQYWAVRKMRDWRTQTVANGPVTGASAGRGRGD
jgi:hypothetical protein